MKIIIEHFSCWYQLELELNDEGITLVKGPSGVGKTTIFKAIAWCLYGQIRRVAPHASTGDHGRTSVTLWIEDMIVTRKKKPNVFEVKVGNNVLEGSPAQEYIIMRYGLYDSWLCACYVAQRMLNKFLLLTASERTSMLNKLSFLTEDPAVTIGKLDALWTKEQTTLQEGEKGSQNSALQYQNACQGVYFDKELDVGGMDKAVKSIDDYRAQIMILKEVGLSRSVSLRHVEVARQDLTNAQRSLSQFNPAALPYSVRDKLTEFNEYRNLIIQWVQQYSIQNQKRVTNPNSLTNSNIEQVLKIASLDLHEATTKETYYQNFIQECGQLGLKQYQNLSLLTEEIGNQIVELNVALDQRADVHRQQMLSQNVNLKRQEINKMPIGQLKTVPEYILREVPPPNLQEIDQSIEIANQKIVECEAMAQTLMTQLSNLRMCTNVLSCPHCQGSVRYVSGKVVISEHHPVDPHEVTKVEAAQAENHRKLNDNKQLVYIMNQKKHSMQTVYQQQIYNEQLRKNNLEHEIVAVKANNEQYDMVCKARQVKIDELQVLEKELNDLPKPQILFPQLSEFQIQSRVERLGKVTYTVMPTVSSRAILAAKEEQRLYLEKQQLELQFLKIKNDLPEKYHALNTLDAMKRFEAGMSQEIDVLNRFQEAQKRVETCTQTIANLEKNLPNDPSQDIANLEAQINNQLWLIENDKKVKYAANCYQTMLSWQNYVKLQTDRVTSIAKLKQMAIEVEHRILSGSVDSINATMNDISSKIFSSHTTLNIELFKLIKSSKYTKPQINFSINRNNEQFGIDELSGGEAVRASIALTMAFNKLNNCPFLIFDEAFDSIDIEMRNKVLSIIKKLTNPVDKETGLPLAPPKAVFSIVHGGVEGVYDYVVDVGLLRPGS